MIHTSGYHSGSITLAVNTTLDEHAAPVLRGPRKRSTPRWYCADIRATRKLRCHNENVWRASDLEIHRQINVDHRNAVSNEIRKAKIQYYQNPQQDADQSAAFKAVDSLLNLESSKQLDTDSMYNLCY